MARRPRIFVPGYPFHVVHRGNDRRMIFADDADRFRYLDYLVDATERHECAINCYVLMGNHVHLLATPATPQSLGKTMQSLGIRYVRYFNARHDRTGGLWEGRYKAMLVGTDRYLSACYRYIELNPVRAGLVADPLDWRWSSHRFHVLGEPDRLVCAHSAYAQLGDTADKRQQRYRARFSKPLSAVDLEEIREAAHEGFVFGGEALKQRVENQRNQRVRPF